MNNGLVEKPVQPHTLRWAMGADRFVEKFTDFELEKVFSSMTELISVHDRNFRIVRVNRAFCDFIGRSQENLLGNYCYEVYHGIGEPWHNCPYKMALKFKGPITEIIEDDNLPAPLLVTCSPIFGESEQIVGAVHVARDISQEQYRDSRREQLIGELRAALTELKVLTGILTICVSCKNVRKDDGDWVRVEKFIAENTNAMFSHGICPDCVHKIYPDLDVE